MQPWAKGERSPALGVTFTTHGNYASDVFDPMTSDTYLEIHICDDCIVRGQQYVAHVQRTMPKPEFEYSEFRVDLNEYYKGLLET